MFGKDHLLGSTQRQDTIEAASPVRPGNLRNPSKFVAHDNALQSFFEAKIETSRPQILTGNRTVEELRGDDTPGFKEDGAKKRGLKSSEPFSMAAAMSVDFPRNQTPRQDAGSKMAPCIDTSVPVKAEGTACYLKDNI